jgi:hypothetical protein
MKSLLELFSRLAILLNASAIGWFSVALYADTPPWRPFSVLAPNGRYYASVGAGGADLVLTVAERKPGSSPVRPSVRRVDTIVVGTRAGDLELGRCMLELPPEDLLVSSTGLGVVAVDTWPFNQTDYDGTTRNALVMITNKGEIRFRKNLDDLFGDRKTLLMRIPQYNLARRRVDWYRSGWIDEKSREVVIAGYGSEMLVAVSFDTGRVRKGEPEDIYRAVAVALAAGDSYELQRSLPLLVDAGSKSRNADRVLSAVLTDQRVSLEDRLTAGLPLAKSGDKRAADLFTKTAMTHVSDRSDANANAYAITHLQEILGDGALPLLSELIQRNGGRMNSPVRSALESFGKKAVPRMVDMLNDRKNIGEQADALWLLAKIGPDAGIAVPSLIHELHNKNRTERSHFEFRIDVLAAQALGAIGHAAEAAVPAMTEIKDHADAELRQALVEAIARIEKR